MTESKGADLSGVPFPDLVAEMIRRLGDDPEREGMRRTPERVEKAMRFLTSGYERTGKQAVGGALFEEGHSNMIVVKDIEMYSLCEHHLLPFFGKVHVAYIPSGKIMGLSKTARLVDVFARRFQVQERLEAIAREQGGCAWPADLADAAALQDTLGRLARDVDGAPDVVVNAAGVFDMAPLAETSLETFERNVVANLRGPFLVIRALLPAMLARGSGTFVTVGSVAGYRAFPGNGAYSASKFGVRGLHEVLVEELRGTGVRATLVEPSATDTSIWDPFDPDARTDLPKRAQMLSAAEVADAVLYAATRPAHVRLPLLRIERG
jgi:NADP-dependent 3-hydroxy acid dehydrogenase YdfG